MPLLVRIEDFFCRYYICTFESGMDFLKCIGHMKWKIAKLYVKMGDLGKVGYFHQNIYIPKVVNRRYFKKRSSPCPYLYKLF